LRTLPWLYHESIEGNYSVPGNTGLYTKAKSFSELLGLARRKQAKEDQGSKRGFALVALALSAYPQIISEVP
jgi:hypothetical protein